MGYLILKSDDHEKVESDLQKIEEALGCENWDEIKARGASFYILSPSNKEIYDGWQALLSSELETEEVPYPEEWAIEDAQE